MANVLLDPLRHNSWATRELLALCSTIDRDVLDASAPGTYGSVLSTLQHIIGAEGRYRFRLSGIEGDWPSPPEETDDLATLQRMNEELAGFWEELATSEFDPDRTIESAFADTGERFEIEAGVLVAQVLNHGNEHRAQIFTILSANGVSVPELDAWAYGEATGRFRPQGPPE